MTGRHFLLGLALNNGRSSSVVPKLRPTKYQTNRSVSSEAPSGPSRELMALSYRPASWIEGEEKEEYGKYD